MSLIDTILGRPLASGEAGEQRIGVARGVATFGLDALSSAAYGPEAALTVLLPLGAAGLTFILPITTAIVILLGVVYFSYRQTIAAYPNGGGSYTVARENLGANAGLLAAAALMTDYVLNVAVGISAGVGALISAVPYLQPDTLTLCLVILALLTLVNLRGVVTAGTLFLLPTCIFIVCLCATVAWGVFATISAGGHPLPVVPPAPLAKTAEAVSAWLLLRAFASGCTAMTGVEAVSNGVQAFREPVVANARRTLTIIIAILVVLLLGIAYLARAYHLGATQPGTPQYQSVLSQLISAVPRPAASLFGRYLGARHPFRNPVDGVRRRYRPADSAVRGRSISGFYLVAKRDGRALAEESGAGRVRQHGSERAWCDCHRPHGGSGCRREVHGWRLDRGAAGAVVGGPDALRAAPLSKNRAGDCAPRSEA